MTLHQSAFNFRAQRPVTVVAVAGVFEKLTGLHSPLKVFRGQEVVLDSVGLTLTRRPGRGRDRELDLRDLFAQPGNEAALADP